MKKNILDTLEPNMLREIMMLAERKGLKPEGSSEEQANFQRWAENEVTRIEQQMMQHG